MPLSLILVSFLAFKVLDLENGIILIGQKQMHSAVNKIHSDLFVAGKSIACSVNSYPG